jgi:hypothetical protein
MPTITQASVPITSFAKLFISPYGNDGIVPLYSSIPLNIKTTGDCLPCVLCGNSNVRQDVIQAESANPKYPSTNTISINTGA